jgi:Kef-type K+ transport system membrane component KefB
LSLLGIAIATKILGCGSGALLCRFRPQEALTVGVGMVSRGEVALITATIGLQAGLITPSLFSVVILIALVTTLVTPLLLKLVYQIRSPRLKGAASTHIQLMDIVEEVIHVEGAMQLQEEGHVH